MISFVQFLRRFSAGFYFGHLFLNLGLSDDFDCNYESIRKYCSLSFMDCDPFGKAEIRVSNMEKGTYSVCRQIALNLGEELGKTTLLKG
jgi:hypothetical protein